jgi:hypothetical protein
MRLRSKVVLPEPRKPVRIVMGMGGDCIVMLVLSCVEVVVEMGVEIRVGGVG